MTRFQTLAETDSDSPGFEYMRTYQSMASLYIKLIALDYHKEFCSTYKCSPFHRLVLEQFSIVSTLLESNTYWPNGYSVSTSHSRLKIAMTNASSSLAYARG